MVKFIFVYHGGEMPQSEEEGKQVMAQWKAWFESMGEAVADMGAPVGPSSTVQANGTVTGDGGANPTSGYSVISSADIEAAIELAKNCPILKANGSVEVAEAMAM